MKKYISTIFITALFFSAFSQKWCPAGAEWTYNYTGFNEAGYTKVAFEKDTLINNINCKKLSATQIYSQQNFLGIYSNTLTSTKQPFFTYAQNDTVYFFYGQAFHAVYFLNAQKGDTLQITNPVRSINCGNDSVIRLAVDSSGITQINNEPLRFYMAHPIKSYSGQNIEPASITVIEKLGIYTQDYYNGYMFLMVPFFSCNTALEQTYSLRCYKDDSFNLYQTNPQIACSHLPTSIHNVSSQNLSVRVFPNPATAHINITSPHYDIQKVTLFNLFGKQEKTITYNNSKEILVNLSNLLGGVYFVHIHLENGHTLIYKVSKE